MVLKGPGTVIAAPSGVSYVDTEGTSDLGTAGSGDVLSGVMGAVLAGAWALGARTLGEFTEATAAAVWLHGSAGRIAGAPVVATDIADALPEAIRLARFGPERQSVNRASARVDLSAIRRNLARIGELAGPAEVMAVVKADAYGHGLVQVAKAARAAGTGWLGVALPSEALTLRASGDRGRPARLAVDTWRRARR